MRALIAILVVSTGCRAVFGLDDPTHQLPGDATTADGITDTRIADAPIGFPSCASPDPARIACFDFENSIADGSPSNLSVTANAITYAAGLQGFAGNFTNTTSMAIAETASLDVAIITMEAWIRPSATPTGGSRMGIFDNNGQYGMFITATGLSCTGGAALMATATIPTNQWTHVMCMASGTTLSAYVNATLVGTITSAALTTTGTTGASVGEDNPPGTGSAFTGLIDLLRVYNTVRTASQICDSFGCGL